MKHLLAIEELTLNEFYALLENSMAMVEVSERDLKKVPALRGKTVVNLFFESSTRTRTSFEIAAKRLSADVINISSSGSSVTKGETLLDTARTLEAMKPDILVVRHSSSGAPTVIAKHLKNCSVINAGDGTHEHPTQAILDCLTLKQHFSKRTNGIQDLQITIVGDVLHSRVARSTIWAHLLLGNRVHVVGPRTLLPPEFVKSFILKPSQEADKKGSLKLFHKLAEGIEGCDVVMCLRMQLERQEQHFVPSLEEYCREYGINEKILRGFAPEAVVMHPGPINRGIEVSSEVADGPRSLVSKQVENGIAARMGILFTLLTGKQEEKAA